MDNKRPKRRKDKYNPYTLSKDNKKYYVSFKNADGKIQKTEVDKAVFEAFDGFELDDISIMNEAERHYEYSELTEETWNRRAVHKTKTVEDIILTVFENEMLSKAICELTEIQRKRLLLYYYDHLTYEQIAKIEGCTKMPVMRSIKKAEEKIKKFFKKRGYF
mgnify:FL=1